MMGRVTITFSISHAGTELLLFSHSRGHSGSGGGFVRSTVPPFMGLLIIAMIKKLISLLSYAV
jgi:hypothetical protein